MQERVDAVTDVHFVVCCCSVRPLRIVMIEVNLSAEHVKAMNLVEHVETANISVIAETVDFRPFGHDAWVVADIADVLGGDGNWVDVTQPVPGHVDFVGGVLAID